MSWSIKVVVTDTWWTETPSVTVNVYRYDLDEDASQVLQGSEWIDMVPLQVHEPTLSVDGRLHRPKITEEDIDLIVHHLEVFGTP